MAVHLLKFVDSIAASPTERLNINDGTIFSAVDVDASPPRLRRAMSQNAMTDGGFVSSSQYEMRIVKATLLLSRSTQDLNATQLQLLARELDRADNYLMFQPNGLTKPVFFRTVRSDFTSIREVPSPDAASRAMEFECLAEPFALGLQESFTGTFTFDGAAGSFEVTTPTILGDVTTPLQLDLAAANLSGSTTLQAGPGSLVRAATNASLGTLGTDASAVTGAGTTYWNGDYVSIDFATSSAMVTRLQAIQPTLVPGVYRLLAHVAAPAGVATFGVRARRSSVGTDISTFETGDTVTVTSDGAVGANTMVDLGTYRFPFGLDDVKATDGFAAGQSYWMIQASRTSGSIALRIDGLLWLPLAVDDDAASTCAIFTPAENSSGTTDTYRLDAERDAEFRFTTAGSVVVDQTTPGVRSGALPHLRPGAANKLRLIPGTPLVTTATTAYTGRYNPAYLYVRPSAT